jgi:5'-nucleotidase / UDP-sugar diphosphatase
MNKKIALLFFGILLLLSSFSYSQKPAEKDTTEIIILHTNDMHAKIDNMAKLAYLVDSLKKTHLYVFLVAAGDNFTGNPVVDMVTDKGYPMIDLMNRCGFNVSSIGNHEFDLGQEILSKRFKQANFPFISCNIDATGTSFPQPKPYMILDAGNQQIAILGIIQLGENGLPDSHPSKLAGLHFTGGIQKAKEFGFLKDQYGNLVALTHLGIETDKQLADSMPKIDIIIGGHSHTLIDTVMTVNNVMIVQAGSGLKYIGKITLKGMNGKIIEKHEEIIPVNILNKEDTAIRRIINQYNHNEELQIMVGTADTPVTGFNELGSLMTDAQRFQSKVDFAFQNSGGIRVQQLSKGNITIKDIYQLDPFQNEVILFTMTGKEIQSLICNAYNREKTIDLAVSGMTYTVIIDKSGICREVIMLTEKGQPIDLSKEYSVALNSYIAASYRFDHHDPGKPASVLTEQLLIDYLKRVKTVNYTGVERTFLKTGK